MWVFCFIRKDGFILLGHTPNIVFLRGSAMSYEDWLQHIQNSLDMIKQNYPKSSLSERTKWQNHLSELKKKCDYILESWVVVEEEIAHLIKAYPELLDNDNECDEEIWLTESAVRQFRQGQGYYGLTMFYEAKSLFEKVVQNEPDFLLGRIYLGLSEFQENRLEEASYHFRIVSKTGSKEIFVGFAEHMLGCIAVKHGEDTLAIKHFSKTTKILPDQSDAWFNLGACHFRLCNYQEAIPNFYHALAINEDDWESMYYLSSCYRHHNEWGSVSYWRMASYEKTNHPQIIESIAQDYEEMNQPDEAIHWYRRLLDMDKQNSKAFHGIAWNLWVKNDAEESLSWIKRGLSLFPHDGNLLFTFIWICMAQGDIKRAEIALGNLPEGLLEDPLWIAVRSRLHTQRGDFNQAIEMAEQLISQEKANMQALGHYQMGRILMEMNNGIEAIRHFQEATQLNSGWKDPLFFEGICHMVDGRVEMMLDCWNQLNIT